MPDKKEIGERIKILRYKNNLTQEQLATMIGVTRQAICNYETGDAVPSDDMKYKISTALGADIIELFFKI